MRFRGRYTADGVRRVRRGQVQATLLTMVRAWRSIRCVDYISAFICQLFEDFQKNDPASGLSVGKIDTCQLGVIWGTPKSLSSLAKNATTHESFFKLTSCLSISHQLQGDPPPKEWHYPQCGTEGRALGEGVREWRPSPCCVVTVSHLTLPSPRLFICKTKVNNDVSQDSFENHVKWHMWTLFVNSDVLHRCWRG